MKIKLILTTLALITARLAAETVATDTAVFIQTDAKSPIIARLKAGALIVPVGEAPAGWKRIEVAGPFDAYVNNRDVTKSLDVREGASIHSAPSKDSPVMTIAQPGDKTELVGLANSDWALIKLDKPLQGFIAVGATANTPSTAKPIFNVTTPPPASTSVTVASSTPVTTPGRPAAASANNADLARVLTGKFVVAKRLLNLNPPYDYQLMDSSGRRLAYIDTKRLLLTDKLEAYIDRSITVTGTWRNTLDGKDLVIAAESLKLN
ncbi:SH3 domain-containing protein [Oleiharenicola lentus]|uniref:SH3 domain-containing protein n=1 Tax=Oleiharenicola lentus TaxID=2508720 RepID=UPI003F66BF15